ncbi:Bax inhibitor-1/YccA family protein [Tenacibaculum sp. UWU-22]|uniref:Bax inhibitor-1/YccA family protein n=1 Tax=Tenacibaculum sp. UWU-22 TaxID=3234187 RepID=UPI0034DADC69
MSVLGLRTSNPAFTNYFWHKNKRKALKKMSLKGIVFKSLVMLCVVSVAASYTWQLSFNGVNIKWYTTIGAFVAIVISLFISFKHSLAKYLLPMYALAKGFFLGGISLYAHNKFPGLPFQAIAVTIVTFFVMLLLYITKVISVTKQFQALIITATISVFTVYFLSWVLTFVGFNARFIWGTSWLAIGFNVVVALVASFSLLLDFYYIDRQIGYAPKEKEWLATWGILITLIWLYIEVLRLLKKLAIRF